MHLIKRLEIVTNADLLRVKYYLPWMGIIYILDSWSFEDFDPISGSVCRTAMVLLEGSINFKALA